MVASTCPALTDSPGRTASATIPWAGAVQLGMIGGDDAALGGDVPLQVAPHHGPDLKPGEVHRLLGPRPPLDEGARGARGHSQSRGRRQPDLDAPGDPRRLGNDLVHGIAFLDHGAHGKSNRCAMGGRRDKVYGFRDLGGSGRVSGG